MNDKRKQAADRAMEYMTHCGQGEYVRKIQDYIHALEIENIKLSGKIDNLITKLDGQIELFG